MKQDEDAYITEAALAQLRETVRPMMSEKRYAHTCAVEDMVARLCALYCPEQTATLQAAALLHDITKEQSLQNQLQLCEKFDIMVTPLDVLAPKTFHAKTAAALIARDFSAFASETVVSAVRWHTTGRAGMTLTEQLLYLADYIDQTRTFADCVALRDMFFDACPERMEQKERLAHLRRVLVRSFDMTVRALLDEGAPISNDTMEARNDLLLLETQV